MEDPATVKQATAIHWGSGVRVGAVIPAFQAEETIADVVARTLQHCRVVVVVVDGCSDDTACHAREAGAWVVEHEHNKGKGAALQTGMQFLVERGADAAITLDADGQHLPEEIPRLLQVWQRAPETERADLVLGTREHLFAEMSRLRRTSNAVSSKMISSVAGVNIGDIQTGFRLYGRELITALAMPGTGFEAESAIVVLASRRGFRVTTTPIQLGTIDGRETSHYRPLSDSFRIAKAVFKARFLSGKRTEARHG